MANQMKAEKIAKFYVIILLALYPFYTGQGGYASLSASKTLFLGICTATCLILVLLFAGGDISRTGKKAIGEGRLNLGLLGVFLLILISLGVTAIKAGSIGETILSERGPLMHVTYFAIFLFLALYGRWEWTYSNTVSAIAGINAVIITLQLRGYNPFQLYPEGLTYYDAHVKYSGSYLGTMGNADILCVWLAVSVVICLGGAALEPHKRNKVISVLGCASAVYCGIVANTTGFLLTFPIAIILVGVFAVTNLPRLICWCGASTISAAAALTGKAMRAYSNGTPFWIWLIPISLLLFAGVIFAFLYCRTEGDTHREFSLKKWYCCWAVLIGAVAVCGIVWVYQTELSSGFLYEIHEILHGRAQDSFGSQRVLIWRRCLEAIRYKPLLGWGEPFTNAVKIKFETVTELGTTLRSVVGDAHNIVLSWLVHNGVIGTVLMAMAVIEIIIRALRRKTAEARLCAVGMLTYLVIECTCLGGYFTDPLFWCLGGLSLARSSQDESKLSEAARNSSSFGGGF